ncbi:GNAT family N-acetyltransferase [Lysobacteraceae bacterium NML120232]|nr:GNAT family N-acetyltransferase [Xanthomonadaceae bacterium NML120232]
MTIRHLQNSDVPALLPLMQAFCVHEQLQWDSAQRSRLLQQLLENPQFGAVLLAEHDRQLAAYAVIGFCFSLEFAGRFALLDELYVAPEQQGQGLGKRLMQAARQLAAEHHCPAIRLEVSDDNPKARDIYQRSGYRMQPRRLMSQWLELAP